MHTATIDYNAVLIWAFGTILTLVGLVGGLAFVFATEKAIRIQARYNTLLADLIKKSGPKRGLVWHYRLTGCFIAAICLFLLVVSWSRLVKELGWRL
ncbi:MAG: hypothetical protein KIT09_07125 [Bryobacteraceae bacterium]|nr:hypothetical protein [Bryobacteraceae bacterium]